LKPTLCPFAEFCTESENNYTQCSKCLYSKRRTYYKNRAISGFVKDNKVEILKLRKRIVELEKSKAEEE